MVDGSCPVVSVDGPLLEQVAARRRFESRTLEIARRLFIHRQTPKRVASEFGVNLQRVYAIRKEILSAVESLALPPGWARNELVGPRELVEHHRRLFDASLAQLRHEADLHPKAGGDGGGTGRSPMRATRR